MARILLPFFNTENRLYGRAQVTAFTVSGGAKTATKATLYAGLTGSTTLSNPQTLNANGRLAQPVYIEADVILTIAAVHAASHDTGIVKAPMDPSSELTIASGEITITSTAPLVHHTVDTESDAASDDLDTINGGAFTGQVLILQVANASRSIVANDGTGNIALASSTQTLNSVQDMLILVYNATLDYWHAGAFANNA